MQKRGATILSIASAFVIGGLIGAAVALLMAPQSGEKTRHMIRSKSMEIRDKAMDTAQETRDRASKAIGDVAKQTKDRATMLRRRGQDMVSEQKDRLQKKAECA